MADDTELSISLSLELAGRLRWAKPVPFPGVIWSGPGAGGRAAADARRKTEAPTDVVSQAEAARFAGVSRQAVNQWVKERHCTYVAAAI